MLPVCTASRHFFVHVCVWSFCLGITSEISWAPHGTSAGLTLSQNLLGRHDWTPLNRNPVVSIATRSICPNVQKRVGVTRPVTCQLNHKFSFNMDQSWRKKSSQTLRPHTVQTNGTTHPLTTEILLYASIPTQKTHTVHYLEVTRQLQHYRNKQNQFCFYHQDFFKETIQLFQKVMHDCNF